MEGYLIGFTDFIQRAYAWRFLGSHEFTCMNREEEMDGHEVHGGKRNQASELEELRLCCGCI